MMTSAQEYREVLLEVLPDQGELDEEEYLWLTDRTSRLLEFTDGYVEVLPMPTSKHQGIVLLFIRVLLPYLDACGGILRFAPMRLRLRAGKFREPDLMLLLDTNDPRNQDRYWLGADLVLEVVSPDNPARDLVEKRQDYAAAGIPEYWIVNPLNRTITVLVLRDGHYVEHGIFTDRAQATSVVLAGFSINADGVFNAA
jgi:Uma2 family endonuclease